MHLIVRKPLREKQNVQLYVIEPPIPIVLLPRLSVVFEMNAFSGTSGGALQ